MRLRDKNETCTTKDGWGLMQSIAMVLQNSYQRRRLYIRIALGKNKAMDVVSGETSGGAGQLLVLYPVLFALQIFQIVIGMPHPSSSPLPRSVATAAGLASAVDYKQAWL